MSILSKLIPLEPFSTSSERWTTLTNCILYSIILHWFLFSYFGNERLVQLQPWRFMMALVFLLIATVCNVIAWMVVLINFIKKTPKEKKITYYSKEAFSANVVYAMTGTGIYVFYFSNLAFDYGVAAWLIACGIGFYNAYIEMQRPRQ